MMTSQNVEDSISLQALGGVHTRGAGVPDLGLCEHDGEDRVRSTALVVHARRRRRSVLVADAQPTLDVIKRRHDV